MELILITRNPLIQKNKINRSMNCLRMTVETTLDGLLDGRVMLTQPRRGFRVAIDTVFLAAAVPSVPEGRVLDLGCGVGGAALCLLARCPDHHVTGLECQSDYAALARQNAALNHQQSRFEVLEGMVQDKNLLMAHGFDHAMLNPPYFDLHDTPSTQTDRDIANRQQDSLAEWFQTVRRVVRPGGTVSLIYPVSGLPDALAVMAKGMGNIRLLPLWPRIGEAANRVLIQAKLGSRSPLLLLPGIVLHGKENQFTPDAEKILRQNGSLLI